MKHVGVRSDPKDIASQEQLDGKEAAGAATSALSAHVASSDPHPQYTTAAEVATAIATATAIHPFLLIGA